jgi:DNA adenine methylase
VRSFIRWAGSKRLLLPTLRRYRPRSFARYIEPFAGSARLFFDLQPQHAILGDLNEELICTYRQVRRDVYLVLQCLHRLPRGERAYYHIRSLDPHRLSDSEVAARFLYLNHYCFNGLYRTNLQGQFNVPYGPPKNNSLIDEDLLVKASQSLRDTVLIAGDFSETLASAGPHDFVYLDPPYFVAHRRIFSEYHPKSFKDTDLGRLSTILADIHGRGAYFLATYADSPEARRILAPWKPIRVRTRRHIAGFSANRRISYEVLATNVPAGEIHAN